MDDTVIINTNDAGARWLDDMIDMSARWEALTYRWQDRADRWRRYAVTTFIGLMVIWAGFMAYVMLTPVKAPVLVGRTMTIHCPSEDGGRPGCVWDTLIDGNGQGEPGGPRWLVWP